MAHSFQCTSNKACVLCVCPQGWGLGLQDTPLSAAASAILSLCTLLLCVCVCACAILSHSYHFAAPHVSVKECTAGKYGLTERWNMSSACDPTTDCWKEFLLFLVFLFLVHPPFPIFFPLLSFPPLSLSPHCPTFPLYLFSFRSLHLFILSFSPFLIILFHSFSISPLSPLHPHPILHHAWRRWEGIQNIVLSFSFIFFTRSLLHFILLLACLIRSLSTRCTRHAASTKCKSGSIPASLKP